MTRTDADVRDTVFVLFGAAGDLSWRLIVPALFNLHLDGHLPPRFQLLGVDRADYSSTALADHYRQGVTQHARRGAPTEEAWQAFAAHLAYQRADAFDPAAYAQIGAALQAQDQAWGGPAARVFYLATPPSLFEPVARGLGGAGLAGDRDRVRIVVEKPLGRDLASSREINAAIGDVFTETQVFRIDHFLGKETLQNVLAMRFANPIFEPIWNRRYVDHVAITVAETLGVEHRGGYYERAGALRDMVQNHLLQILCLVAMEPPVAYGARDVRARKLDVLRALRPIPRDRVPEFAVRGQYGVGTIDGDAVPAYRDEPDVDRGSTTETYAALKLQIDNWRWQDVPFFVRTGKRMAAAVWEISIRFRDVPHRAFPASADPDAPPARLVVQMQPEQGIVLKFMAKVPGSPLRLQPVDMRFNYAEAFQRRSPDAYETLLRDVMIGDATLFMSADQVEASWQLLMPVLEAWAEDEAPEFPNYAAGSWGPPSADALATGAGRSWLTPTLDKS